MYSFIWIIMHILSKNQHIFKNFSMVYYKPHLMEKCNNNQCLKFWSPCCHAIFFILNIFLFKKFFGIEHLLAFNFPIHDLTKGFPMVPRMPPSTHRFKKSWCNSIQTNKIRATYRFDAIQNLLTQHMSNHGNWTHVQPC